MILSPSENRYGKEINTAGGSPLISPSTTTKSMDDVWNDISLSSFHHRTTSAAATTSVSTHPSSFQDFFAAAANTSCPAHSPFGFTPPPATTAAAAIVLSLNSAPLSNNIHKNSLSTTSQLCNCTEPNITSSIKSVNFNILPPSSFSLPMKRPDLEYCEKHKRLMKNRESAARSRARRQARINELELEVARLTNENAMLKRQQREEKQQLAPFENETPIARLPRKSKLLRTLTAPF